MTNVVFESGYLGCSFVCTFCLFWFCFSWVHDFFLFSISRPVVEVFCFSDSLVCLLSVCKLSYKSCFRIQTNYLFLSFSNFLIQPFSRFPFHSIFIVICYFSIFLIICTDFILLSFSGCKNLPIFLQST